MRVLVVDDERDFTDALVSGLRRDGYVTEGVYDGAAALTAVGTSDVDVMLLDRDLPILTGDAVCRILRAENHPVRIVMLTAAGTLDDRVSGLDLGADDYLAKPFAYVELLARLRALSRRTVPGAKSVLESAGIRVDTIRGIAERDGAPLALTRKEHGVLEALLRADGGYLSADDLFTEVWSDDDRDGDHRRGVVKTTMHTLRRKLGEPIAVHSAPGHGYRIGAE